MSSTYFLITMGFDSDSLAGGVLAENRSAIIF